MPTNTQKNIRTITWSQLNLLFICTRISRMHQTRPRKGVLHAAVCYHTLIVMSVLVRYLIISTNVSCHQNCLHGLSPVFGMTNFLLSCSVFTRATLASAGLGLSRRRRRMSVYVSVTRQYCVKTAKHRITPTKQRDSSGTLVFWRQESLVDDPLLLEICAQSDPPPFEYQNFWPVSAHGASTVRDGKKRSISTNRKSTTRFPTSHRWTVYVTFKSPKGWHKPRFCCLRQ